MVLTMYKDDQWSGPARHGTARARHGTIGHEPVWPACHRAVLP